MKNRLLTFAMVIAMMTLLVGCKVYQKKIEEEGVKYTINVDTKAFKNEKNMDVLNAVTGKLKVENKEIQKVLDNYYNEYENYVKETPLQIATANYQYVDGNVPFEIANNSEVKRNDSSLLSIVFKHNEYLGGANGSEAIETLNFDMSTLKTLNLEDLFIVKEEEYINVLKAEIIKEIERMKVEDNSYIFDDYKEFVNENTTQIDFYFKENYIVFVFKECDIAPSSEGVQEVNITLSSLDTIIKDAYRVNDLKNKLDK